LGIKKPCYERESGLDVNSEKAKSVFISQELNAGQLTIIRLVTNPLQLDKVQLLEQQWQMKLVFMKNFRAE